jgi:hypothetical protein
LAEIYAKKEEKRRLKTLAREAIEATEQAQKLKAKRYHVKRMAI